MIRKLLPMLSLTAVAVWIATAQTSPIDPGHGTIVLKVTGFKSDDGQARVYLFNSADGFPSKPAKALMVKKEKISGQQLEIVYPNLPRAEYAIAVHHDVNGNDKMDTNWMHIPKEPTGASNGARSSFGPPKWKAAKFELNQDTLVVPVSVK